jgi:hypothetical protein
MQGSMATLQWRCETLNSPFPLVVNRPQSIDMVNDIEFETNEISRLIVEMIWPILGSQWYRVWA